MDNAQQLSSSLYNFIGTEQYHYNPLYRWLRYTDGVKFFAENAGGGAYWLLDIIGTEMRPLTEQFPFMSITFLVKDGNGMINVTDGNDHQVYERLIDWTDCPDGEWRFFLTDSVLMLTSEY